MRTTHGMMAGGGVCLSLLAAGLARTQTTPAPLQEYTFETEADGWTGFGKTATLNLTTEAAQVKQGKGALKFDYAVNKDEINGFALGGLQDKLTKMQSLRFWIKTDTATPVVVALTEKDGGRYVATFAAPAAQWQRVELAPSDFVLTTEPNDPKDADGKLDLDQVESLGILDMAELFAQSDNAMLAKVLNLQMGVHTLLLDDVVISSEPLPEIAPLAAGTYQFDKLTRPQLNWIAFGQAKLTQAQAKPLEGVSLQADYHQAPGAVAGVVHFLSGKKLAGMTHLHFDAASKRTAKLVVQVEETGGGKYNATVEVPEGSARTAFDLAFSDFKAADDSHDTDGKLDLDQVKQMIILDVTGFGATEDQSNTLWVNNLRASNEK